MHELPLIRLFEKLRDAGLSLGIREYELLIEAIRGGFGTLSRDDLAHLCYTLWVKSPEDKQKFDYLFERLVPKVRTSNDLLQISSDTETIVVEGFENHKKKRWARKRGKDALIIFGILVLSVTTFLIGKQVYSSIAQYDFQQNLPTNENRSSSDQNNNLNFKIIGLIFGMTIWIIFYVIFLVLLSRIETSIARRKASNKISKESIIYNPKNRPNDLLRLSELTREIRDEVELIKAIQKVVSEKPSSQASISTYLPITQRKMKQCWRYLRQMVRSGLATELDIKATVQQVGKTGLLLSPVLIPRRVNLVKALFLIDTGGSMTPFHSFGQRLNSTAKQGGRLGRVDTYYFHNCPIDYVYEDAARLKARAIDSIISELHQNQSVIIIFSDAGAARGRLSHTRYNFTKQFTASLNLSAFRIVWLNPMPKERWANTTAERISRLVSMFSIDRNGLESAIDALRRRQYSV